MALEDSLRSIAESLLRIESHLKGVDLKIAAVAGPALAAAPVNPTVAAPAVTEELAADIKITEPVLRENLRQLIVRNEAKKKGSGMDAAKDILAIFGAKAIGQLKVADYAAVVKACKNDEEKSKAPAKK